MNSNQNNLIDNGENDIDSQKRNNRVREEILGSLNNVEENEQENNLVNNQNNSSSNNNSFFSKNKLFLIVSGIFLVVGVIALVVVLLSSQKPRTVEGLIVTRQFPLFTTFDFSKSASVCALAATKDFSNSKCSKIKSEYTFSVLNITQKAEDPSYLDIEPNLNHELSFNYERTLGDNVNKMNLYTMALYLKSMNVIDTVDDVEIERVIVRNRLEYDKKVLNNEFLIDDILNSSNKSIDNYVNNDLNKNLKDNKDWQDEDGNPINPDDEIEKMKDTTLSMIFFTVWEDGKLEKAYVPQKLNKIAKEHMILLIKEFNPKLSEKLYLNKDSKLTDLDSHFYSQEYKNLAEEEQYDIKVTPIFKYDRNSTQTTLERNIEKKSYTEIEIPENANMKTTIKHQFDSNFDLRNIKEESDVAFYHNPENSGSMPESENENYFGANENFNFDKSSQDFKKTNYIPDLGLKEVSTKSSFESNLNKKTLDNKEEIGMMLLLAIEMKYNIINPNVDDIVRKDGGELIERDVDENGKIIDEKKSILKGKNAKYNRKLEEIIRKKYSDQEIYYMESQQNKRDPFNVGKDINDVFFNRLMSLNDINDMTKTHSIIYPAFQLDVYGFRAHMSLIIEITPKKDLLETSIVIGSKGLFEIPLFTREDNVPLGDSVDKMIDYVIKGTNIVATAVGTLDRFLGTSYLQDIKSVFDTVNSSTGENINSEQIFTDYFSKFLEDLDRKLYVLAQDFKKYIEAQKADGKFVNPLEKFKSIFVKKLQDVYEKYMGGLKSILNSFIDARLKNFEDILDKATNSATVLFFPDMIDLLNNAKNYIEERLTNTKFPDEIKVDFIKKSAEKLILIFEKTKIVTEDVQDKVKYFFNVLPFEELKPSLTLISTEIDKIFNNFKDLLSEYTEIIDYNFKIDKFSILQELSKIGYNKIKEVIDRVIKIIEEKKQNYPNVDLYREMFFNAIELLSKQGEFSSEKLNSLMTLPTLNEEISSQVESYYTKFNSDVSKNLIEKLYDELQVVMDIFNGNFNGISILIESIKNKLNTIIKKENYISIIEQMNTSEMVENLYDSAGVTDYMKKLIEFNPSSYNYNGKLGTPSKLILCNNMVQGLKQGLDNYSEYSVKLVQQIKDYNLEDLKKLDELKETVKSIQSKISPIIEEINKFSSILSFENINVEAITNSITKIIDDVNIFIQDKFKKIKASLDEKLKVILDKYNEFKSKLDNYLAVDCNGSQEELTFVDVPKLNNLSINKEDNLKVYELFDYNQNNDVVLGPKEDQNKFCLVYNLTEEKYKEFKPGYHVVECLIISEINPYNFLNHYKLEDLLNFKFEDISAYILNNKESVEKNIEIFKEKILENVEIIKKIVMPESVTNMIDKLVLFESDFTNNLKESFPKLVQDKMISVIDSISTKLLSLIQNILDFMESKLIDKFEKLPNFIIKIIEAIYDMFKNSHISNLVKNELFDNVEKNIKDTCFKFIDARESNFMNQYDYFTYRIDNSVPNVLKPIFNNLSLSFKTKLEGTFKDGKEIFSNTLETIKETLRDKTKQFIDSFQEMVDVKIKNLIDRAKVKEGEPDEENSFELNGFFSISNAYEVLKLIQSFKGDISSFNFDFINMNLDLIVNGIKESLKSLSDKALNSEKMNNSIIKKIKATSTEFFNKNIDLVKSGINELLSKKQALTDKIMSFSRSFTSFLQNYVNYINNFFLARLSNWLNILTNSVGSYINEHREFINENANNNFKNFISSLTEAIANFMTDDMTVQQDYFLFNFNDFKNIIKNKLISMIQIGTDFISGNEFTILSEIGISDSIIKSAIDEINALLTQNIEKYFKSDIINKLINDQLKSLIAYSSELMKTNVSTILTKLINLQREITLLANQNAARVKSYKNLSDIIKNKEVEASKALLDLLLVVRKEFSNILELFQINYSKKLENKEVFDTNVFTDFLNLKSNLVEPFFDVIKNITSSFEKIKLGTMSISGLATTAKDVFNNLFAKLPNTVAKFINGDLSNIIEKTVKKNYNGAKDFLFNQLNNVAETISQFSDKKGTATLHILSIATIAGTQAIDPIVAALENIFNKSALFVENFFNEDLRISFISKILKTFEFISEPSIKELINNIDKDEKIISIITNVFTSMKQKVITLKDEMKDILRKDSEELKNKLSEIFKLLVQKLKERSSQSNSDMDFIYKTVEYALDLINNLSFPSIKDFEELLNSSDEMQKKFFNDLIDVMLNQFEELMKPIDKEVYNMIKFCMSKVEEKVEPLVNEWLIKPLESGKGEIKKIVNKGINYVYDQIEDVARKLLELTRLHQNKEYMIELKIKNKTALTSLGSNLNVNDIINAAKSLFKITTKFKSIIETLPSIEKVKQTFFKVMNFAKNGVEVFKESINTKMLPFAKRLVESKMKLYIGYVKEILFSQDFIIYKTYDHIKGMILGLPREILDMALDEAVNRLVKICDDNKGHWAVEIAKGLINVKLYKYNKVWDWGYSYDIYFTAGPVPCVIGFRIGANVFFNFETRLKGFGIEAVTSVGGSVYARASGGVSAVLLEVNAFLEGVIMKLTGSFGANLDLFEFRIGTQICFTGEFGEINVGLGIKIGVPYVKEVCNLIDVVEKSCKKKLGFLGFICGVVKVAKLVCKVIEYTAWNHDLLKFNIVKPYVFQRCFVLDKKASKLFDEDNYKDILELGYENDKRSMLQITNNYYEEYKNQTQFNNNIPYEEEIMNMISLSYYNENK